MNLTINNSTCQISNITLDQLKSLRNVLSYSESKVTRFGGYSSVRKYLIDRKGVFASGLLPRVLKWIEKNEFKVEFKDLRIRPRMPQKRLFTLSLPYLPYPDQIKAVEATESTLRGLLVMPTGSGKANTLAMIIDKLQLKTLVVVPTLELKTQLTNTFRAGFGNDKVGPMDKNGVCPFLITIENVDSMNPKIKPKSVELLLLDEYHGSSSLTYRNLNTKAWTDIYARIGCTASPYRNLSEETLLFESILSEVVFKITYQQAVDRGYIVPVQFFYHELPLVKPKTNVKSYHAMVNELVINRADKNELIAQMVCELEDAGESTLVLLKEIKHGEILQDLLRQKGRNVAFANGNNSNNRELLLEFNLKERKTLIATSVLGMGVDTKPCTYVILAAGGKSKPNLIQNIGRCLRTSSNKNIGTVVLFLEKSHKWFSQHFIMVRKSIKEEYGIDLIKL